MKLPDQLARIQLQTERRRIQLMAVLIRALVRVLLHQIHDQVVRLVLPPQVRVHIQVLHLQAQDRQALPRDLQVHLQVLVRVQDHLHHPHHHLLQAEVPLVVDLVAVVHQVEVQVVQLEAEDHQEEDSAVEVLLGEVLEAHHEAAVRVVHQAVLEAGVHKI